ncbi:hypothetical protein RRG08_053821, partial [Elysia crispata]
TLHLNLPIVFGKPKERSEVLELGIPQGQLLRDRPTFIGQTCRSKFPRAKTITRVSAPIAHDLPMPVLLPLSQHAAEPDPQGAMSVSEFVLATGHTKTNLTAEVKVRPSLGGQYPL